ncbi:gastrula zinc finger protein XlCGF57.1-like [Spodoptera litura]|uniref:Gastrula zinc finger protein XlCGF57.1-like n=1 Tax=Spodoptera litura TaxID=69820 RepID=A0A9J7EMT7_SPOLT|nr:gastrula zinc finger protein XlCGF57.1-like [Spodoptera litura]XP_022830770.1 gastrula zinc finger protein XlCGF57.1-like [Spodoptera litura]
MDSNNQPVPDLEMAIKRSMLAKNKLAMIVKQPSGDVNYSCVECSALFLYKEDLEQHLLLHNREYRYLCGICGTGLKRKEHLDRHTLEHQEVRPHICPHCGKGFKRKEHMTIHLSIHGGDKSETCPVCHKTFYRKDHLRKHLQTHTKVFVEQNSELVGEHGYVEIKQEILDEYSTPANEDEEQPAPMMHPNSNYEATTTTEERFNNSDKIISAPRPFKCLVCQKTYKRKDHLKIHSWTHLKKEKTCSECGKAFHTDEHLLEHMSIHLQPYTLYEGPGEYIHDETINHNNSSDNSLLVARQNMESRPHECEICRRRFKRKQHLKVHMKVHSKQSDDAIWCSYCGEGFLANEQYERHQCQFMSQDDDIKNEPSEQNEQSSEPLYPQVIALQEHKKENKYPAEYMDLGELAAIESIQYLNVVEKEIPVPQRVFVCKYCNKPFKRKDHYKIHLNIHTGIKSFFCTKCGKGFYRKDHLQKHMSVHNKNPKPKKEVPALVPIHQVPKKTTVMPEITIHAPSTAKLRVPLQIKVPYQMIVSMDNGEQREVTVDPQASDPN